MTAVPAAIGFITDFRDYSFDERRASSDPNSPAQLGNRRVSSRCRRYSAFPL